MTQKMTETKNTVQEHNQDGHKDRAQYQETEHMLDSLSEADWEYENTIRHGCCLHPTKLYPSGCVREQIEWIEVRPLLTVGKVDSFETSDQ